MEVPGLTTSVPTVRWPPEFMVMLDVPERVKAAVFAVDVSEVAQSTPVTVAIVLLQDESVTVGPHPGRSPVGDEVHAACAGEWSESSSKLKNTKTLFSIRFIGISRSWGNGRCTCPTITCCRYSQNIGIPEC